MANKPNNPSLWSRAKSLAKEKFDVYPSAYANGWAAKWYKSKGGTWRKAMYGMEVPMMEKGGKPEWLLEAQLKAQGYSGNALQQKMSSMAQGGEPQNAGFQALPEYVQANILSNMGYGGYYNPMMSEGGTYQDIIDRLQKREERLVAKGYKAVDEGREKKADRILGRAARVEDRKIRLMESMGFGGYYDPMSLMQAGGEPDGEMALGQMAAIADKMTKLRSFIGPDADLEPWISSKLAVMDHYADAVSDYMTYGPDAQEMEMMDQMKNGGYTVTRSNDRKGKTHKVTGPDGTVKYFGDSKLGQHPKDPERKKAFYARHKKNLDGNPYFRAFARATWEDGGEIDYMANGGYIGHDGKRHMSNTPTWSGNAGYEMGGVTYGNPFLPMAQYGLEGAPRQEDYPDYQSYEQAMLDWTYGVSNEQPVAAPSAPEVIERDIPGGGQQPLPLELQGQAQAAAQAVAPITYKGPSIVDMLSSAGKASDYNSRKQLAAQLGIDNYYGSADQNIALMKKIANDPSVLNDYKPVGGKKSNSGSRSTSSSSSSRTSKKAPSQPTVPAAPADLGTVSMFTPEFYANQKKNYLAQNPNMSEAQYDAMFSAENRATVAPTSKPMPAGSSARTSEYDDTYMLNRIKNDPRSLANINKEKRQKFAMDLAIGTFAPFLAEQALMAATTRYLPYGLKAIPEVVAKSRHASRAIPEVVNTAKAMKTLPNASVRALPNATPQLPYATRALPYRQEGGFVEGQEIDVTSEELEILKAQGYQFEII